MTPAGPRLSSQTIRRLRLGAWIFCGLLTLWLVVAVLSSVIGGIIDERAVDPFTGQPVRTAPTPPQTSAP